jgi:hypothetical protein
MYSKENFGVCAQRRASSDRAGAEVNIEWSAAFTKTPQLTFAEVAPLTSTF